MVDTSKKLATLAAVAAAAAFIAGCGGGGAAACVDTPTDVAERINGLMKPGYTLDGLRNRPTSENPTHIAGRVTGMDATAVWATNTLTNPQHHGMVISVGAVTEEVSRIGSNDDMFPITDDGARAALDCW